MRASGLDVGLPLSSLTLDARGAVEALQLQGEARGDIGTLTLSGNAAKRGTTWQGALASLQLAPAKGASWRLQEAARFRWDGRNGALSSSLPRLQRRRLAVRQRRLAATRTGRARAVRLPLSLLVPYLPEREDKPAVAAARRDRARRPAAAGRQCLARTVQRCARPAAA